MNDYRYNFRRVFADEIHRQMSKNNKIWIVVGDLGYRVWDPVRKDFPDRFINAGAAEQSMVGIGVGLALRGKIPIVYSITSFLLFRPFETIRNYINREKIPVKLVGSGRDRDYEIDGFSHWATEDKQVMKIFNNIKAYWPKGVQELLKLVKTMIKTEAPYYLNLKK